jgi:enoyl-CoA hydratase
MSVELPYTQIRVDRYDRVAVLHLSDPDRRNALNPVMCAEMVDAIARLTTEPDIGALVVTGDGRAFCAGADLSQLGASQADGLKVIYSGFLAVAACELPTVAAVNGAAVGAGMNLALACDVRIAAASARFDTRFLDLGLHPGGGHTWMMRRIMGQQGAFATVLFGEVLDAARAERKGLVWEVTADDAVLHRAVELAARAASGPPELVRTIKATIDDMANIDLHTAAVERELGPQVDSLNQPAFRERLAALQARITSH